MNTQGIIAMSNGIGRLLQGFAAGTAESVIDDLLLESPETEIYIHDDQTEARGYQACCSALKSLARRQKGFADLTHSAGFRECEDGSVMGHWNTYTYRKASNNNLYTVTYSYWRITARFVQIETGEWKMSFFSKIMAIQMDPWPYDPSDEPGIIDKGLSFPFDNSGSCNPQDYVELRNLAGHIAQEGFFHCQSLWSLDNNTVLDLPDVMPRPAKGLSEIHAAIDRLQQLEEKNLNMYVEFLTVCTPVITSDGKKARASFLGNIIQHRGPAFGYEEAPYRRIFRLAVIYIDYIRENGVWKIRSFRAENLMKLSEQPYMNMLHDGSDGVPGHIELMGRIPNRYFSPRWEGVKNTAEDIFTLESVLPEWTERLKRHDLPDFPDKFMTNSRHDLVIMLSRPTYGNEEVHRHCNHLINEMYEGHETMWHNPQFHTGCSPVIEISSDGISASAWFIDKCWGNIGMASVYDENTIQRYYYPGFGVYCHQFIKENGEWRLWRFGWVPMMGGKDEDPYRYTYSYQYGSSGGWSDLRDGREWPLPFEDFRY